MGDLTSLFGKGRGEHPRNNHHKEVTGFSGIIIYILGLLSNQKEENKIKAYGQLVLLGYAVTSFTPVAYQRHSL